MLAVSNFGNKTVSILSAKGYQKTVVANWESLITTNVPEKKTLFYGTVFQKLTIPVVFTGMISTYHGFTLENCNRMRGRTVCCKSL
jgi:hypothetical protein